MLCFEAFQDDWQFYESRLEGHCLAKLHENIVQPLSSTEQKVVLLGVPT